MKLKLLRRSIVGAIALTTITVLSYGQTISAGAKIGITRSEFNDVTSDEDQTGFTGGAALNYKTEKNLGFSADLLYAEKGYEWAIRGSDGTIAERWESSTTLRYLEMPLQVFWYLNNDSARLRPKVGVGPAVSFLLNASHLTKYTFVDMEEAVVGQSTGTYNATSMYNRFDIGAVATAGFDYRICPSAFLTADVRYYWGLNEVGEDESRSKNRNWSLMLGMAFPINR